MKKNIYFSKESEIEITIFENSDRTIVSLEHKGKVMSQLIQISGFEKEFRDTGAEEAIVRGKADIFRLENFCKKFGVDTILGFSLGGSNTDPLGDWEAWAKIFSLPISAKNWLENEDNLHSLLKEGAKCFHPIRMNITEESKIFVCKNPKTNKDLFCWSPFMDGVMILSEHESINGRDSISSPLVYREGEKFNFRHKAEGVEFVYKKGKMYALFS